LKKHLDVVYAVLEHRETVHAHAERKAAYFFRVVVHEAVDRGINHARAEKFNPAGAFAFATCRAAGTGPTAAAENAGDVEFPRRFGERKITRTKTRFHAGTKILFDEIFDGAGEIAERDI